MKEGHLKIFNYILLGITSLLYLNSILKNSVGVDASYFIRISECIYNGSIPSIDLRVGYTPMVFFTILPVNIIDHASFRYYLILMYLIQIAASYVIFKIVSIYSSNKQIALLRHIPTYSYHLNLMEITLHSNLL